MHIILTSEIRDLPFNVAKEIVHEFLKENPQAYNAAHTDLVIHYLTQKISDACEKTYQGGPVILEFDISLDTLPERMRSWASAHPLLKVRGKQ